MAANQPTENANPVASERKTPEQRATMSDIERLRHSAAHVLATAVFLRGGLLVMSTAVETSLTSLCT